MTVWITLTSLAGGLALLALGGEALIRGAVSVARQARLSPAVIGLTIVAMGTSLPELSVSLLAAADGRGDIAMGNVVGSNIFNVAAIVGLTALVRPIQVHLTAVKLEWPFMFTALFVCLLLARDGFIDRLEAGFFLVALLLFTGYAIRVARTGLTASDEAELADEVQRRAMAQRVAVDVGLIVLGLVLLAVGARFLVAGAVTIAQFAGLSERVIGLTIVAAGTSLPELAASVVAARRGQPDIALANVIGSNVFNVLGILGVVGLVEPQAVNPQIVASDNWWMVGTAFVLLPLMATGMRVSRLEGLALLAAYVTYVALLL
ncbi:MAG: calcium/sodium antiporter [Gemmatimonadetes bacterium]|nr:calcium/sodium antiporter [Gemmatimonadota bacterium]